MDLKNSLFDTDSSYEEDSQWQNDLRGFFAVLMKVFTHREVRSLWSHTATFWQLQSCAYLTGLVTQSVCFIREHLLLPSRLVLLVPLK